MSIAILVLGYSEPKVLAVAARFYSSAGFRIFVHLDSKRDIETYRASMGEAAALCQFIDERYSIFWGGFRMVEATIALMNTALKDESVSRLVLLSDDSFPIKPAEEIKHHLSGNIERISARKLSADDPFMRRYNRFYYFDHQATSLLGREVESAFVDDAFFSTVERLHQRKAKGKAELAVHYGSQWWCISRDLATLICRLHADDTDIRESFEFSAIPDEIYFPTLAANFFSQARFANNPVLVDWTRNPRPFVFSDVEDIRKMAGPDHYFARKIKYNSSEKMNELMGMTSKNAEM